MAVMAKWSIAFSPLVGCSVVFPDVLVPVPGQPKMPSDLIGVTMHVPSAHELEEHIVDLGANPSFTKHMETFHGMDTMVQVTSQLYQEIGLAMPADDIFQCAHDSSCLQVWTTANALTGKTVRITTVLGSWSMSEIGVGNVCHVNAKKDVAYCHVPSDAYKSGLSWLAMGVPVDEPLQEPLPIAVRCHDMGPSSEDAPCHLLSGNEFMAAQLANIDTRIGAFEGEVLGTAAGPEIVSLGWGSGPAPGTIMGGSQCLDVGGGAAVNMAPLQLWSCLGNSNQDFDSKIMASFPGSGQIRFRSVQEPGAETCIDVPGGNLVAGQTIWMWQCDDLLVDSDSYQVWALENGGTPGNYGPARLLLANFPGWCLERPADENDGDLPYIMHCSDSEFQQWTFCPASNKNCGVTAAHKANIDTRIATVEGEVLGTAVGPEIVSLGWGSGPAPGTIMSGSQCLDVGGGVAVTEAPLQMWSCLGNSNQNFDSKIMAAFPESGQIKLHSVTKPGVSSTTCIDVPGGNLLAGQTIRMRQCDDLLPGGLVDSDSYQVWQLENGGQPGNYGPARLLLANFPGWCLERPAEGNDGDLPYIMPCADSEFQQWTFCPANNENCGVTALQV